MIFIRRLCLPVLGLLLVQVSGCQQQGEEDIPLPPVGQLPASYKDHYAELKQLSQASEEEKTALFNELARRSAAADYILQTQVQRDPRLQLELLEMRNDFLLDRHFDQIMETAVTEDTVYNHYRDNPDTFLDTYMRVAYVLLPKDDTTKDSPLAIAGKFAQRLRDGDTLLEVVSGYKKTAGQSARMGELQLRESDTKQQSLFFAARKLALHEVSGPVETQEGVYVIKLLEGPVKAPKPFIEVGASIRKQLEQEYIQAEMQRLLQISGYAE